MQAFRCERCGGGVSFSGHCCPGCNTEIGYLSEQRVVREIARTVDEHVYRVDGLDDSFWRCLNAAWGCNWLVRIGDGTAWCRSCRVTTGRCDVDSRVTFESWLAAEDAKRRVVHLLEELRLVTEAGPTLGPDGLAFDLALRPAGIDDRADDAATIDVSGFADQHCVRLPAAGRTSRAAFGRLSHQLGHHYWNDLVGATDRIDRFRDLFGDERHLHEPSCDVADPDDTVDPNDPTRAMPQPLEDWAETFGLYLGIVASSIAVDRIAAGHAVSGPSDRFGMDGDGKSPSWPSTTGAPVDRLAFVHHQICTHARRGRLHVQH
jgi:hypothetical protein